MILKNTTGPKITMPSYYQASHLNVKSYANIKRLLNATREMNEQATKTPSPEITDEIECHSHYGKWPLLLHTLFPGRIGCNSRVISPPLLPKRLREILNMPSETEKGKEHCIKRRKRLVAGNGVVHRFPILFMCVT
ncbi:hypothetical protein CEXT_136591 [Caerostris extrusa]|uniref:Uncharacterized protein n=1 Tax=Caerostris extrusa TaxID=172846 RepID=A0AAV4X7I2_CAEEX|nr:hypothetical protein CEXT_136591 [Caerostris extrusa]